MVGALQSDTDAIDETKDGNLSRKPAMTTFASFLGTVGRKTLDQITVWR